MDNQNVFIALGTTLVAAFGACVKWLNAKGPEKRRLYSLLAEAAGAAFAGLIVYFIYAWLRFDVYIALSIAGVVGHQGAKGLDMLINFIIVSSGISKKGSKEKDE